MTEIPLTNLCFVQGTIPEGEEEPNRSIRDCMNRYRPNHLGTADMTIVHPAMGTPVVLFQCHGKQSSTSQSVPNAKCFCGFRIYGLTPVETSPTLDLPRYFVTEKSSV